MRTRARLAAVLWPLVAASGCAHVSAGGERARPAGAPAGIAVFTDHDRLLTAKISPKGRWLAAVAVEGGKRTLVFIDLATRKIASTVSPQGGTMIGRFYWVNDGRVIAELVDQGGDVAALRSRGELYSIDARTGSGRLVFGYRAGEDPVGSRVRRGASDLAMGFILDTLPNDDRRVLVESRLMDEVGDRSVRVLKLDVVTGVHTQVAVSPIPEAWLLTDENGEVRLAGGSDENLNDRYFLRRGAQGWKELPALKGLSGKGAPVGYVARDDTVYVVEPLERGGFGLFAVGLERGERRLLARNERVPPSWYLVDPSTRRIVAVEFEPDVPTYEIVDPEHPLARVLRGLLAAHPDEHVRIVSSTLDEKKLVAFVYGDRNPGHYLLVDVDSMSAEKLVDVRPWIRPEEMSPTTAFHVPASDGVEIHGYLTLPRGAPAGRPPPLVVLPHGGPHLRDRWGFDPEVQLLASEGFAVLQVNFRGSDGYGDAYLRAGYRRWGDRVVLDVVDATRWAIRKGYADPGRICIYGASFGGYAALQGASLAPDLFRCAVGYAGIYDLTRADDADFAETSRLGRGYVRTAIGEDEAALRAASPAFHADRIKARVLLVHGREDRRVPIGQAERLRKALEESGNPPEWLVEPREGHGFYDEAARERMYRRLIAFLRENTAIAP